VSRLDPAKALESLAFIEVPEGFAERIGSLVVDRSVPLPLETSGARIDATSITPEAILSGMLRFLAAAPDDPRAAYYRAFVAAVKPDLFAEFTEAGIMKAKNGDWDVAEEIFRVLEAYDPESPVPKYNLAILLESRADAAEQGGRTEECDECNRAALELYRELVAFEPPFPDGFFAAAHFHLKLRNYERARELFDGYLKVGDEERKLANSRESIATLDRQGLLDEAFKQAYDFIGMGQEERGIEKAREFLAIRPDVWNAWFLVGWGLRRLGRYRDAIAPFERAIELEKAQADVYNELSICYMETGRLADARKALEKAFRLEPENTKILSNLGVLAARQGNVEEAAGFFRTALEIDPGDEIAAKLLEGLDSGQP
jgi:tetratricopeptide (TPR) repeat protein